ncbi:hypothetical protein L207DRAFT_634145 [Hyaloscypha variabilis F]|uniref:BZIP domain-containing protein n=1 Tax=Hyaloscypha variabilis (strain UAMH 11265 / GT02V1 / F) TaxID=1149755 RepID=A0A2J6RM64_HYAVF|nr:hypothetical protein L207DRAFT_634145 [Hyaloscypha variabilis F]
MDSHPVFSANLPGVHFQDPSGLDHCQPSTGWNSNSGFAMIDQSLTLSPTQLFDLPLGFHNLPGTNLPNDVANTLPNSFSVDIGLPSPKNTKRRAQNRASQKAFRQRQVDYIRTLEQQLEELRTKYGKLCTDVQRIKQAVDALWMEGWGT